jgi:hypothetical protein
VRRLLALVAAVALIGAALWFHERRERSDADASGGPANGAADGTPGGVTRLICPTELRPACERAAASMAGLRVTVEPAGSTADRLADAAFDPQAAAADVWLTPPSWAGAVGARRQRDELAPVLGDGGPPLATTPLVYVAWPDRWAHLGQACGGPVSWPCLAEQAARNGGPDAVPWEGGLKVGWDPATDALAGLAEIGQMTAGLTGRADVGSNELDEPGLVNGLRALEAARPYVGSAVNPPLRMMMQFGRSRFDLVGTAEALARAELGTRTDVVVEPAPPPVRLDLLLVPLAGRPPPGARLRDALADALTAANWVAPQAGDAAADGLPSAGTLEALRGR